MKTFVLGDIHGNFKALQQCFERSGVDKETDRIIFLGDVVDGWSETYECVDLLLSCKNLVAIKGNHDDWWSTFLATGTHPAEFHHGGKATLESYSKHYEQVEYEGRFYNRIPELHHEFFNNQLPYFLDTDGTLYVHGGFNRHYTLEEQPSPDIFWWDRDLIMQALSVVTIEDTRYQKLNIKDTRIKRVFIGHTATILWKNKEDISETEPKGSVMTRPIIASKVINVDTGAGFKGKLTIMNVETLEYWQSDRCDLLYPDERGRN